MQENCCCKCLPQTLSYFTINSRNTVSCSHCPLLSTSNATQQKLKKKKKQRTVRLFILFRTLRSYSHNLNILSYRRNSRCKTLSQCIYSLLLLLSSDHFSPAEFQLRTSQMPSSKEKIFEDMKRDEVELIERRWPFVSRRAKPLSSSPSFAVTSSSEVKTTVATELKKQAARRKTNSTQERHLSKEEVLKRKVTYSLDRDSLNPLQQKIAKTIASKLKYKDHNMEIQEKVKALRKGSSSSVLIAASLPTSTTEQKQREMEYKTELATKMKELEEQRVFLFERVGLNDAKTRAVKKAEQVQCLPVFLSCNSHLN